MKIKINENETYEIKLNDEVSLQSLKELIGKIEILSGPQTFVQPKTLQPQTSQPQTSQTNSRGNRPKHYNTKNSKNSKIDFENIKCIKCEHIGEFYNKGFSSNGSRRLLCKLCKTSFTIQKEGRPILPTRRKPMKWNGREDIMDALKIHYFGQREDKLMFAEKKGTSWDNIAKTIHVLRKRHNISPQEIGLKEFPTVKKGRMKVVKLAEQVEQPQPQIRPVIENPFGVPQEQPQPQEQSSQEKEEDERHKWWGGRK